MSALTEALAGIYGSLAKVAEADVAQYIVTHKDAILALAEHQEVEIEKEIVNAIVANLPTGGAWAFGLRASVAKTIEGAGAQIVADLGGRGPALLVAVQAALEKNATSP